LKGPVSDKPIVYYRQLFQQGERVVGEYCPQVRAASSTGDTGLT